MRGELTQEGNEMGGERERERERERDIRQVENE